jgi:hypothetical protein
MQLTALRAAADAERVRQETEMLQTYKGSCHCGRVTFEVRANFKHVIDCNCSPSMRQGLTGQTAAGMILVG